MTEVFVVKRYVKASEIECPKTLCTNQFLYNFFISWSFLKPCHPKSAQAGLRELMAVDVDDVMHVLIQRESFSSWMKMVEERADCPCQIEQVVPVEALDLFQWSWSRAFHVDLRNGVGIQ